MTDASDAIISIHPEYATAILDGTKTIELRRRIPSLGQGARLWIYATRPTAAIVGIATIASVSRAHPRTIWQKHRSATGVDYASFTEYFAGTTEACRDLAGGGEACATYNSWGIEKNSSGLSPTASPRASDLQGDTGLGEAREALKTSASYPPSSHKNKNGRIFRSGRNANSTRLSLRHATQPSPRPI